MSVDRRRVVGSVRSSSLRKGVDQAWFRYALETADAGSPDPGVVDVVDEAV